MPIIKKIEARELLDSRGFPTVEAEVFLNSGQSGKALVPSGASTGSKEALELRDRDPARFMGKGVQKAIENILQVLGPEICGKEVSHQHEIDERLIELDGTPSKEKYGANAILAVSLACAQAAAKAKDQPLFAYLSELSNSTPCLPFPLLNILNGGAHADNSVDIQEFMIIPVGASHFKEAMQMGVEVYHCLKQVLKGKGLNTNVGDEGGFAPNLPSNTAALDMLMLAIEKAGFKPGREIYLALDVAASEFYREGKYHFASEKKQLTTAQFIEMLKQWVEHYPILSIEDGMDEGDSQGWEMLTQSLGKRVQLVGDDLFVTCPSLFERGISSHLANAILIKPNQVGTLTETLKAIHLAKNAHYNAIISHRSGETEDTFIADLAVGTGVGQIKTGAPCRSDRTAKYNQLLRIASQYQELRFNRTVFQRWGIE